MATALCAKNRFEVAMDRIAESEAWMVTAPDPKVNPEGLKWMRRGALIALAQLDPDFLAYQAERMATRVMEDKRQLTLLLCEAA